MVLKVDQAGRLILPKAVRERMGLGKDSRVELEETSEGIMLKPVGHKSGLVRRNGRLVFIGKPVGKVDWDRIVEQDRDARMRYIAGL